MRRYPRTVREFVQHMREVHVHCGECQHRRKVPPDVLEAAFGPDFDLYDGYAALVAELRCDRCGKKPLYWTRQGGGSWFASEIKSLLCVPGFERRLNLEAMHHFLSYKHVPHPLSIFEGVHMLPPGSRLRWREGRDPVVERYWRLSFAPDPALKLASEEELVDRAVRQMLDDSHVRSFLPVDVASLPLDAKCALVAMYSEVTGTDMFEWRELPNMLRWLQRAALVHDENEGAAVRGHRDVADRGE